MHIGTESVASITAVNIDEVNLAAVLIPNVVGLKYPYIFASIYDTPVVAALVTIEPITHIM